MSKGPSVASLDEFSFPDFFFNRLDVSYRTVLFSVFFFLSEQSLEAHFN